VLVEAWRRVTAPPEAASGLMLVVALVVAVGDAVDPDDGDVDQMPDPGRPRDLHQVAGAVAVDPGSEGVAGAVDDHRHVGDRGGKPAAADELTVTPPRTGSPLSTPAGARTRRPTCRIIAAPHPQPRLMDLGALAFYGKAGGRYPRHTDDGRCSSEAYCDTDQQDDTRWTRPAADAPAAPVFRDWGPGRPAGTARPTSSM
jgi:hypothetical protein